MLSTTGACSIPAPASGSALAINGSAYTPIADIANSSTAFTRNRDSSNVQTLTMTGNVIAANFTISNPRDGQTINLFITQGAGPYTLGWPTSFKWSGGTLSFNIGRQWRRRSAHPDLSSVYRLLVLLARKSLCMTFAARENVPASVTTGGSMHVYTSGSGMEIIPSGVNTLVAEAWGAGGGGGFGFVL